SLSRAANIPARFVMGYPIPKEQNGIISSYHCWAEFYSAEQGWIPVDISEASKYPDRKEYFFGTVDQNRVHFTTGRDIKLNPPQLTERLNYFIKPYIEVDDVIWHKYKLKILYKNL
ncbi:MAG: transglutaminase-like domain-containing protein, partial [Planctomycetota bacterium]